MLFDATQQSIAAQIAHSHTVSEDFLITVEIETLIENGIAQLVVEKISQQPGTSFKAPLLARLKQFSNQLNIIHALQHQAFNEVFQVLKKHNIDFIVLKGWALSYTIYSSPHHRPKTDIDILIADSNKQRVKRLLLQLGYTNPRGWEPEAIIDQFSMRKMLVKGVYANIDVHLRLTNDKTLQPLFPWSKLLASSCYQQQLDCRVISKPYALLHAVVHLLHHACNGDFIKLIWFYDIYQLTEILTPAEVEELVDISSNTGLSTVVTFCLKEQCRLFSSKKTDKIISQLNQIQGEPKYNYLMRNPSRLKVMIRNFLQSKGLIAKTKVIKETLFPPREEIYLKYGRDSKWPLLLLYLRRILSGFIRIISR